MLQKEVRDTFTLGKRPHDRSAAPAGPNQRARIDPYRPGPHQADVSVCSSIVDVFDMHAQKLPSHMAVMELWGSRNSLTWCELKARSLEIAASLNSILRQTHLPQNSSETVALLMKRSCTWLAITIAILRCGRPFVWLSAGEGHSEARDANVASGREAKRRERNIAALRLANPCCLITGTESREDAAASPSRGANCNFMVISEEDLLGNGSRTVNGGLPVKQNAQPRDVLGYMFTGGSTGAPKSAEITHAMALHEVLRYPSIVALSPQDRVLQHTSVFWAASAWGQIDIALAFGAAICISRSPVPSAREIREAGISVVGVAPSTLVSLLPSEAPCLRCIFSWGEALLPSIATRWRNEGVRVIELLISTEYWLSFYNDEARRDGGATVFKVVDGVKIAVLPQQIEANRTAPLSSSGVGELCIGGPAVMARYTHDSNENVFLEAERVRYYRAKDIVSIESVKPCTVVFCGRSDSLIKVGAEFVNLADLEQRLQATNVGGGLLASVLPAPAFSKGAAAHAFIAPRTPDAGSLADLRELLQKARDILPRGCALHLLNALPRDSITSKVDRRALSERIVELGTQSVPYGVAVQGQILWRMAVRYPICWTVLITACYIDAMVAPLTIGTLRLLLIPYLWHSTFYLVSSFLTNVTPFGRTYYTFILLAWDLSVSFRPGWFFGRMAFYIWSIIGLCIAIVRRRPLSWFVAFWASGPNCIYTEVEWWLTRDAWRWLIVNVLPRESYNLRSALRKSWFGVIWYFIGHILQPIQFLLRILFEKSIRILDAQRSASDNAAPAVYFEWSVEEDSIIYQDAPLSMWRRWEKHWWKYCALDIIEIDKSEGGGASQQLCWHIAQLKQQNGAAARAPSGGSSMEARLVQLVDKHLHLGATSVETSLAGVNSLSFMALCRAVRSELGRELEPDVAMGCQTVGALLAKIKDLPSTAEQPKRKKPLAFEHTVHFTPAMWKGMCSWLYQADEDLDPVTFQAAVRRLIARHESLRCELQDPADLLSSFQNVAGLHVALWPYLRDLLQRQNLPACLQAVLNTALHCAQHVVSYGLKGAWPRVGPTSKIPDSMIQVVYCRKWNDVLRAISVQRREFKSPISIYLFVQTGGRWPISYVHVICSHAFSDGFTGFPLINDLADEYEAELGGQKQSASSPPAAALEVLQQRFFDALDCRPFQLAPEKCSLRNTELYPAVPGEEPLQYKHEVCFEEQVSIALRRLGQNFSIPLDVVMLGVVSAALFRTGVADASGNLTGGTREGMQRLSLALYTPMRDGPANDAMIGLFSDWRELSLSCTPGSGMTTLGHLLEMSDMIRRRQWNMYDAVQHMERILVNILALDDHPRGAHGFREVRVHSYVRGESKTQEKLRTWDRALRPLRLTLMQCEADMWWLGMDISEDRFPAAWTRRFVSVLEETVQDLLRHPLSPLV